MCAWMSLWGAEDQSGAFRLERMLQRSWLFSITAAREWIVSGTLDGKVAVIDAQTWGNQRELQLGAEAGIVYALHVLQSTSDAPASLIAGTQDGNLSVWNTLTWQCEQRLHAHEQSILALASVGSEQLITGSADGTIAVWSTSNWEEESRLHDHEGEVSVVEVFDGRLFSAAEDCVIRIWVDDGQGWWDCEQQLTDHQLPVVSLAIHQRQLVRYV